MKKLLATMFVMSLVAMLSWSTNLLGDCEKDHEGDDEDSIVTTLADCEKDHEGDDEDSLV